MSECTLVIGESGTGKSTSLRNLDPKETYIINVLDKPLPFRGYKANYKVTTKENPLGNYKATDDFDEIIKGIKYININRPDIKNIIIDDYQYVLANEYMRRAKERGFDKFTEIAQHAWLVIKELTECRNDLFAFVLCHSDADSSGKMKCKTIGKMLDEKITLEGMFTCVLHTQIIDSKYKFLTQNNGNFLAKSPFGMFDEQYIDNDLQYVRKRIIEYARCDDFQHEEIPIITPNIQSALNSINTIM